MLRNLFESFIWVCKAVYLFFYSITLGFRGIFEWLGGFAPVNAWFFKFFLPKLAIVVVGLLVTQIPLWILIILSFLPPGIVGPTFFVAFIVMFKQ